AWLGLARLDAMRFAFPAEAEVGIYGSTAGVPSFPGFTAVTVPAGAKGDEKVRDAAIGEFRKALDAEPRCALCGLGLGSILEAGDHPDAVAALEAYRVAFKATRDADAKREYMGPWDNSEVSVESGDRIVALLSAKTARTKAEDKELADVKAHLAAMRKKPRVISPVVFGFAGARTLNDLLAPANASSGFDLDTLGGARWPWVKPTTAFLVWDPGATGRVEDGAQLFGNATWHAFFRDGYAALAALDDDGNGVLEGRELDGIGVWCDANGNGVADPGEVQTASYYGITRIAARASGRRDGVPFAADGVRLRDGWTVPTWDWTPRALAPSGPGS
ncbi:MAG TPA: hypothetical protein VMV18_12145, partial [bacterium]|nr:hypothetical protein [bacterium]